MHLYLEGQGQAQQTLKRMRYAIVAAFDTITLVFAGNMIGAARQNKTFAC